VYDRLANPANFPAANPFATLPAHGADKKAVRDQQRKIRDQPAKLAIKLEEAGVLKGHSGPVFGVDGNYQSFFSCSLDNTSKMWDGETQKLLCTFEGPCVFYVHNRLFCL
jgi:WD40 repeat protein